MDIVVGIPSNIRFNNIMEYLNLREFKITTEERRFLSKIYEILEDRKIDGETSVAILQSFENKLSHLDGTIDRLRSFHKFLDKIPDRSDLMSSIKDMGLMSKSELENSANETGNWLPFMRRIELDNIKRIEEEKLVNKQNEI